MNGKIPNYTMLKKFSYVCYLYIRFYNFYKFEFHPKKCVFISYYTEYKGYKYLDASGRVYIIRNIEFNEKDFPFTNDFPSQLKAIVDASHSLSGISDWVDSPLYVAKAKYSSSI